MADIYLMRTILLFVIGKAMGRIMGSLGVRIRHIITYTISPYEQRVFPGFFSEGLPNLLRRSKEVVYAVPGLGMFVLTYYFATKSYEKSLRKNPKDYENDE